MVVPRAFHDPAVGWFPPDILPRSLSLTSWREVLADRQIPLSAVLGLVVSSIVAGPPPAFPTARALARFDFPLKRAVEPLILAPLIVPGVVVAVQIIGTPPPMIRVLTAVLERVEPRSGRLIVVPFRAAPGSEGDRGRFGRISIPARPGRTTPGPRSG